MTVPAVANGVVYVTAWERRVYAFPANCGASRATCSPLWTGETSEPVYEPPAVAGGVVYVSSAAGKVYAFPAECGTGGAGCAPLWIGQTSYGPSAPAVADGIVNVAALEGGLYAFAAHCGTGGASCSPLWTGYTISPTSSPAVARGTVYVGAGRLLYAFPAACGGVTCAPRSVADTGPTTTGADWLGNPAVANGRVYVQSPDKLFAFPSNCGGGVCTPLDRGRTLQRSAGCRGPPLRWLHRQNFCLPRRLRYRPGLPVRLCRAPRSLRPRCPAGRHRGMSERPDVSRSAHRRLRQNTHALAHIHER